MYKAVCINTSIIEVEREEYIDCNHGDGLVKGKIYTISDSFFDEYDNVVYCEELNEIKLAVRFRRIDHAFVEEVIKQVQPKKIEL